MRRDGKDAMRRDGEGCNETMIGDQDNPDKRRLRSWGCGRSTGPRRNTHQHMATGKRDGKELNFGGLDGVAWQMQRSQAQGAKVSTQVLISGSCRGFFSSQRETRLSRLSPSWCGRCGVRGTKVLATLRRVSTHQIMGEHGRCRGKPVHPQ